VDSLVHDFGVFQFACSGLFQLKKKIYRICSNTHPYYFPKRKKEKKESYLSSGGMQRCKGGEARAVYIPLLLCQPGTYICSLFYSFGLISTTATLGVVVGVLVDRHISKGLQNSCYRF
jgi:hypothetical protein